MIIFKKYLGQNFLINKKIVKQIINLIKPYKNKLILEIGCGTGLITKYLIKYNILILAVEIDIDLINKIKKNIINKIIIINDNFLNINLYKIYKLYNKKITIIGNIPYYITRKIIIKLINNFKYIKKIFILVQKEFGEMLLSNPGNKKYCKTTVLTNMYYKIKILIYINKINFFPKPKINSVFLKLTPKKTNINLKILIHILNNCFIKKNKKLYNNIKNIIDINKLNKINILDINTRINKISIINFYNLTKIFNKIKK